MTQLTSRLRARLNYANITASLALFIALGGTSYAALTLPRNSVGSTQIRKNAVGSSEIRSRAVGSSEIRNHTIQLSDMSTAATNSLRGTQGPAGPSGITYRAAVGAGGGSVRGNATGAGHLAGNEYHVTFPATIHECVYSATLAAVQSGASLQEPPAGRITVADDTDPRGVLVKTYDAAGSPIEAPFHLIVAC